MAAALVHPYLADELAVGRSQAEAFLERLAGDYIEADALAQAIEIARHGSLARMRGFASRLQEALLVLYAECVPAGADPRDALYPIGGRDDVEF
jgi:hypothetical protein